MGQKRRYKELVRLYALTAATFDTVTGLKQELKRMSAELDALKAAVAEVKNAVVHTPGMLESLVTKAEAAIKAVESKVVAEAEAVAAEVEALEDHFEHKPVEAPAPVAEPLADEAKPAEAVVETPPAA